MPYTCPICGYPELIDPPRTPKSGGGSYEICPSCRFQFGVSDDDRHFTYDQWREQWIANGMIWDKGKSMPSENWDPRKQLLNIGVVLPHQANS